MILNHPKREVLSQCRTHNDYQHNDFQPDDVRPDCIVRTRVLGNRRGLLARSAPIVAGTPIANTIRKLRFENGEMTQQALAGACGITRQTVIALEAGKYAPSPELAFRISHAFDVGLEYVFQWQQ